MRQHSVEAVSVLNITGAQVSQPRQLRQAARHIKRAPLQIKRCQAASQAGQNVI